MPTLIMLIVMVALIWFMQRSQKKQEQEQVQKRQEHLKALQKGDEIVTIGGLYGIIDEVDVDNQKMVLDIDGVYLTFELGAEKCVVNKAQQEVVETAVVEEAAEEQAETTEDTAVESED